MIYDIYSIKVFLAMVGAGLEHFLTQNIPILVKENGGQRSGKEVVAIKIEV